LSRLHIAIEIDSYILGKLAPFILCKIYYVAVLVGRITALVCLSLSPSVCSVRVPNSKTKKKREEKKQNWRRHSPEHE